jgi:hypothetical protein
MKKIILIIILNLCFMAPSLADDIRDFQIEGISIGDSLLDYLSKEKIINIEKTNYPRSKKFYSISILANSILATSNIYDQFTFAIKQDDKKYIIYALSGDIRFKDDLKGCLKQKKEIVEEISSQFTNTKKENYTFKYKKLADGKSISEVTNLNFQDASSIRIYCNSFTKQAEKRGLKDVLSVNVSSSEIMYWLENEAY